MLIGGKKPGTPAPAAPGQDAAIMDVTTANFETAVLQASMTMPVLVDFWAPWCGPCKQLMPLLDAAVTQAGGKVRLAKVNIDENPELAQALRVQSVPTVFAFFRGQPVTAFTGMRGKSEITLLVDQLVKLAQQGQPDAVNIPDTLTRAGVALAGGEIETAQGLYAQVLGQDENNAAAYSGLIRSFIAAGDTEQAQYMIDDAPESIKTHPDLAAARTALELAAHKPELGVTDALAKGVAASPDDHAKRFDYALALFAAGQRRDAVTQLLDIMRRDRTWEDDKARAQILKFFDAMGPADPDTLWGRRQLSSLLFS